MKLKYKEEHQIKKKQYKGDIRKRGIVHGVFVHYLIAFPLMHALMPCLCGSCLVDQLLKTWLPIYLSNGVIVSALLLPQTQKKKTLKLPFYSFNHSQPLSTTFEGIFGYIPLNKSSVYFTINNQRAVNVLIFGELDSV